MKNPHILIVDDDTDLTSSLKLILTSRGYRTSVADNGAQALDLLRKCCRQNVLPDLVLTDLKMPVMDGMELMDQMRREEIPVRVAVATGYHDWNTMERLKRRDCPYVLYKPFDAQEFLEFLQDIFPSDWNQGP
ncbi:response regulator [Desulfonatronospira sp.]|uniref:response regulator n=1 Tax=Desulfonatronospira sp. TaxID=1962951 RepID=UPI0025B9147A|nr:response regulator [Desulfonatronospira sp.]